jgi:hypothetical protein
MGRFQTCRGVVERALRRAFLDSVLEMYDYEGHNGTDVVTAVTLKGILTLTINNFEHFTVRLSEVAQRAENSTAEEISPTFPREQQGRNSSTNESRKRRCKSPNEIKSREKSCMQSKAVKVDPALVKMEKQESTSAKPKLPHINQESTLTSCEDNIGTKSDRSEVLSSGNRESTKENTRSLDAVDIRDQMEKTPSNLHVMPEDCEIDSKVSDRISNELSDVELSTPTSIDFTTKCDQNKNSQGKVESTEDGQYMVEAHTSYSAVKNGDEVQVEALKIADALPQTPDASDADAHELSHQSHDGEELNTKTAGGCPVLMDQNDGCLSPDGNHSSTSDAEVTQETSTDKNVDLDRASLENEISPSPPSDYEIMQIVSENDEPAHESSTAGLQSSVEPEEADSAATLEPVVSVKQEKFDPYEYDDLPVDFTMSSKRKRVEENGDRNPICLVKLKTSPVTVKQGWYM